MKIEIPDFMKYGNCPTHGRYDADSCVGCRACHKEKCIANTVKRSGVPLRYLNASLDAYQPANETQVHALEAAKQYAAKVLDNWDGSLLLLGPCGTGKTHIACGIILECAQALRQGWYATAREIVLEIRSGWRNKSERGEEEIISGYANVSLLVIDELGAQAGTENELQLLFDILDARYSSMLPTIVCSNLNGDQLKAILGQRIIDRLRDNGSVVAVTGESYRKLAV